MIDSKDISVVIQGPIVKEKYNNEDLTWTQKCIQQVRKLLPESQIILSTWEGEDDANLPAVDKVIKIEMIKAVYYDEFLGIYDNTNRQILTTLAGLNESEGLFALKIRTDTILSSVDFLSYFDKYKSRDREYSVFESRIVASSVYAKKYAGSGEFTTKQLFQPSDIILFGYASDLKNLYDIPLNTESDSHFFRNFNKPCFDAYTHMLSRYTPEQHIFVSCLRKNNKDIYWPHRLYITKSLESESEKYICDNYIFVDQSNFCFEVKGHIVQQNLDDFVWNGLYRESVWIEDYNRIYNQSEAISPSNEEKYRGAFFTKKNVKKKARSAIKYSLIILRLGTKIKLFRVPYAALNKNIHFRNMKERAKRRMVSIPSIGKQNEHTHKDVKVVTNITQIEPQAERYDVISFDIFDTLLRRHVEPVYVPLAQTGIYAEFLLNREGIEIKSSLFNRVRQEVVNNFYDNNRKKGLEHEYSIDEVIKATVLKLGIPDEKIDKISSMIVSNELKREIETLYVADGVERLLSKIKASGKKIIAVSDMYFSCRQIKKILQDKNLLDYFDNIYVSSEYMLTKYSGRLFDIIKNEMPEKKIIHIGDNVNSDAIAPRRRGITGVWLNDNKDMFRRLISHDVASNKDAIRNLIESNILKHNDFTDEISSEIFKKISYDFMAFSHHIIQYSLFNNIDRLYFLERDGSIFCDIIKELSGKLAIFDGLTMPEMVKVKMPRRVSAPLSDISDPEKVIKRAYKVGIPDTFSLSFVMGAYGVSSETISRIYPEDKEQNVDIKAFIDNYESEYKPLLIERREEVIGLLGDIGFFKDGRIGVIDIGWGGTSQKDIGSYISERSLKIECHGIYYGVDDRIHDLANYYPYANKYFGYHNASDFFGSYSLLEFLIKNYGIDKDPKDVSPETIRLNNLSRNVLLSSIDSYAELVNKHCLTADNISSVTSGMVRDFVNKPSYSFVSEMKGASFSLDRKEGDEFVLLVDRVKLNLELFKSIRRLDKNAQWVWGSLVYSRLGFLVNMIK